MMNKLLTFEKKEYLCKVKCQNLNRMELKTLIAECTAYDFKVMLEEKKPKSWLKSVSTFAFFCLLITIL